MEDKKLDEVLKLEDTDIENEYKTIKKRVKRGVQRNIYTRSIITITCFILVLCSGYFGISKLYDMKYYNPTKNSGIDFVKNENNQSGDDSFDLLMELYFNIYNPDYTYYGYNFYDEKYQSLGFGNYITKGSFFYNFNAINYGSNIEEIKINKNKITIPTNVSKTANIFLDPTQSTTHTNIDTYDQNSLLKKIEKMPESSVLNVAFSFKDKMDIETFLTYKQQFVDSQFMYLTTKVMGSDYLGFAPYLGTAYEFSDDFSKKYPNLVTVDDNSQSYINHYVSMLKLLENQKEFLHVASKSFYDSNIEENIQSEIEKVEKNGLEILGFKVHGSKADVLAMLQSDMFCYVYVSDAKFSEFSNSINQ